jgi:hypothetical protein
MVKTRPERSIMRKTRFSQFALGIFTMKDVFIHEGCMCQLFVHFSFLDAFHMKYLLFLKDMLTQNVPLL